jgi:phage terminase large subunit-like protein
MKSVEDTVLVVVAVMYPDPSILGDSDNTKSVEGIVFATVDLYTVSTVLGDCVEMKAAEDTVFASVVGMYSDPVAPKGSVGAESGGTLLVVMLEDSDPSAPVDVTSVEVTLITELVIGSLVAWRRERRWNAGSVGVLYLITSDRISTQ